MKNVLVCFGFVLSLGFATSAAGKVLVNEAMVNEPGAAVTLEWVELYNDSSALIDLNFHILTVGSSSVNLAGFINPESYLVVCRRLISSDGTLGFEEIWGNNSGVWGDAPIENYRVVEGNFSLTNAAGTAWLYRLGTPISQLNWPSAGGDGVSWERISPQSDDAVESTDPQRSTPGRINAVSPVAFDLTIGSVLVEPDNGSADITVWVRNIGLEISSPTNLIFHTWDPIDTTGIGDTLELLAIAPMEPGDSVSLETDLQVAGIYQLIGATSVLDDRTANNQAIFRVPGAGFPPVQLTELLANPESPLETEWVELLNVSDSMIDLRNWKLGDEAVLRTIIPSSLLLGAGERMVLAQDSSAFRAHYVSYSGLLHQPTQWPSFNNAGDAVRLVDPYAFEADQFLYSDAYEGNVTWSRDESGEDLAGWGQSADTGGTPGARNTLRVPPSASGSQVIIEPRVFSPDGDGFEEVAVLTIQAPQAESYTLRIYDRIGRLVKTFVHDDATVSPTYVWDGRTDSGERLPIGIYVCFFEASGVESVKKTVVIAR